MTKETSGTRPSLTTCQSKWLEHLETWRGQEMSLKEYAVTHGLSVSGLYTAKGWFKRRGIWSDVGPKVSGRNKATLVPVRVTEPVAQAVVASIRVRLPNGIVVEIGEHAEPVRCRELVSALLGVAS